VPYDALFFSFEPASRRPTDVIKCQPHASRSPAGAKATTGVCGTIKPFSAAMGAVGEKQDEQAQHAQQMQPPPVPYARAALYCLLNITASVCIVFANKLVLSHYKFK